MSNLSVFSFNSKQVRTVTAAEGIYFVGKDVAEILGYSNPQKALRDHCKASISVGSLGVNDSFTLDKQTKVIPERDVYRLIMRSKLPSAEQFEEWVVSEVLPSIRKTGSYTAPTQASRNLLADKLEAATVLADALNLTGSSRNGAFRRTVARLDADLLPMIPDYAIDAPVVAGQEGAQSSEVCFSMTEMLKRNGSPIGAVKANKILIQLGILEEKMRPGRKGEQRKFKCITQKGLKYGKNVVAEQSPLETQPHWFECQFSDLLALMLGTQEKKAA